MAILNIEAKSYNMFVGSTQYGAIIFTCPDTFGTPSVVSSFMFGAADPFSTPFPTFPTFTAAIAYFIVTQGPTLMAQCNTIIDAPVYSSYSLTTINPAIITALQSLTSGTVTPYPGVTVTGGNAVIYLTTTGTSTGTALYSSISHVQPVFVTADPTVAFGQYTLSTDLKTLTIPCAKQTFSGVTVLGINVLGAMSVGLAPAGISLIAAVTGKLA